MTILRVQLVTLAVAASYLTLGVFAPEKAEELWAWYAAATFLLAVTTLWCEWRLRGTQG